MELCKYRNFSRMLKTHYLKLNFVMFLTNFNILTITKVKTYESAIFYRNSLIMAKNHIIISV